MSKISAPKGTRDILPPETAAWQHAEKVFADVCSRYGYQEIRIPTFEQTELFQRGVGDTTDVVQKEMYTFDDKGGRSMTLRPEGTAGVVRSYLENGMASLPSPVRLFYNITAFRYEKMQKGRYREFHQFGCEVFGSEGPIVDAELVSLLDLYFRELGLKETSLRINSIGCPVCRAEYNQKLKDYLAPHLDALCETCSPDMTEILCVLSTVRKPAASRSFVKLQPFWTIFVLNARLISTVSVSILKSLK